MNKRSLYFIAILVILVAALFSAIPSLAEDSYAAELDFLSQLGITDGINKDGDAAITRAEFAAMTVRMINAASHAYKENSFRDINGSQFVNEICIARDLGIVSGTTADTYSPDEYVAFPVAAKMMTSALGYGSWAEALGGYPTGYLKLASDLDVLKGVNSGSGPLKVSDAARLIYNALHTNALVITGIADDRLITQENTSKSLLSDKFKLKATEGVVGTADFYSISLNKGEAGIVTIGSMELKSDRNYSSYLGIRCRAWYDTKTNTIAVIEKLSSNRVEEISAKNLSKGAGLTLLSDDIDSKKVKSYRLDSGFTYVLNGRATPADSTSFNIKEGSYTLIDNDNDNDYDIVLAYKKEYFVVRSTNDHAKEIYDKKSTITSICFDDTDNRDYEIWLDGTKTYFGDLNENMVLEVYMSKDLKLCRIYASQNSIYGKISELNYDEGRLCINDSWYDFNTYFEANEKNINLSNYYDFFFAPDGSVCFFVESTENSMQYGYYLGYQTEGGMDAKPRIKLLDVNNEIKAYPLPSEINFNGTKIRSTSDEIKTALLNTSSNIPKYQLIKYHAVNGEITAIKTASDYVGESWLNIPTSQNEDSFIKYLSKVSVKFKKTSNAFAYPNVPFTKAVIFAAPKDMKGNTFYEDDWFRIMSSSNFDNDGTYILDVFDYDENFVPAALVAYRLADPYVVREKVSEYIDPYMVEDLVDAIDSEGMPCKKLKAYSFEGYKEVFFDMSMYKDIITKNGGEPNKGDLVRVSTNPKGYIVGMETDIKYDVASKVHTIKKHPATNGLNNNLAYIGGEAVTKPGAFFAIEAKNNPDDTTKNNCSNVIIFRQDNPYYLIYSRSTGKVRLGNSNDITAKAFSGDKGSDVVLRNNMNGTLAVLVYED